MACLRSRSSHPLAITFYVNPCATDSVLVRDKGEEAWSSQERFQEGDGHGTGPVVTTKINKEEGRSKPFIPCLL